jgi:hypothetical protein
VKCDDMQFEASDRTSYTGPKFTSNSEFIFAAPNFINSAEVVLEMYCGWA